MMKSLSLTFFKLGCLWLLALSFSVLPSVGVADNHQDAGAVEAGDAGGDSESDQTCSEAVSAAAEAAVGMDMTSYLAVQQTVGSVNETVSKGNVKKAYKGSALINTTMATVALTRCRKCKDAMQRCEEICEGEITDVEDAIEIIEIKEGCEGVIGPCSEQRSLEQLNTEKAKLEAEKKECRAKQTECSASCNQALISGLQAFQNNLAANYMSDCQGKENCEKKPELEDEPKCDPTEEVCPPTNLTEASRPSPSPGGSPHSDIGTPGLTGPNDNNGSDPNSGLTPETSFATTDSAKSPTGPDNRVSYGGPIDPENPSPIPSTTSDSDDSPNTADSSGDTRGSNFASTMASGRDGNFALGDLGKANSKLALGDKKPSGDTGLEATGYISSKAKREVSGASSGKSSVGLGGAKSDPSGNTKMAMAGKDTLGAGRAKESIFAQMSRIITKVCHTQKRCYQTKAQ